VVRLHPEALTALGLREWDGVSLIGARRTAAVVGRAPAGTPAGTALLDDVTLSNAGLRENAGVVVAPAVVYGARRVTVSGSRQATQSIPAATLRQALLGKVVTVGDTVSLLPRELGPDIPSSVASQALSRAFGIAWTSELLTVVTTDPPGAPVSVQPNTAVEWTAGVATGAEPAPVRVNESPGCSAQAPAPSHLDTVTGRDLPGSVPVGTAPPPELKVEDLAGVQPQAAKLTEWLSLALDEPELLKALGANPRLGVLVTGPAGVGKTTLARAVVAPRRIVELDGPSVGAAESGARLRAVAAAAAAVGSGRGGILLITDIDALLPEPAEPVATLILDQLRAALAEPCVALLATTAHPAAIDRRLRAPDLCDREVALTLPTAGMRRALLEQLLRKVPTGELRLDEIASSAPGFVVADLAALCREAALRAAARASRDGTEPLLEQEDLRGALEVIRPLSRSGTEELALGDLGLDDVGDMAETKQALTEAVLWPLRCLSRRPAGCCCTARRGAGRPSWCGRWRVAAS
jgi:transitional endoplasmic reticulum ATPase